MTSPSKRGFLAAAVLALVAIGVTLYLLNRSNDDNGPKPSSEFRSEQLFRIVELRNLGIAELENNKWKAGSEAFQQLVEILPDSASAFQNLSIGLTANYLNLDPSTPPEELDEASSNALDAINRLRELDPDSPISFRLEARLLEKQSQTEEAVERLQAAAEKAPDDPTIWYEISRASQTSRDPEVLAAGRKALDRLHELVPENVFAFMQWMNSTLQDSIDDLPAVVAELETLLKPLAPGIQKRNRYDVMEFVESVKANIEQGNLDAARNRLAPIKNIVTGDDVSRSDRDELDQDLLVFVDFGFSEELQTQLDQHSMTTDESITVSFRAAKKVPTNDGQFLHVQFADLDLNGKAELIVLTQGAMEIFSYEADQQQWSLNQRFELPSKPSQLVFADLDYDLKDPPSGAEKSFQSQHTADLDLICYGESGVQIYRNSLEEIGGNVGFEPAEFNEKFAGLKNITEVVPADLNSDGDIDLAIVAEGELNYWNNTGDFEFEYVELPANVQDLNVQTCVALDFDRDIDIDIILLLENGELGILDSYRHGTFRWSPFGQSYSGDQVTSMSIVDADRNGSWDIAVGGDSGIELLMTHATATGKVIFRPSKTIGEKSASNLLDIDYDNDGRVDFAFTSEDRVNFLQGSGDGKFEFVSQPDTPIQEASYLTASDYDSDGDTDLAVIAANQLEILTNEGGNQHSWLDVSLLAARVEDKGGSGSQRINHYGYGSLIEIRSGNDFQQAFVTSPTTRFGLGEKTKADAVRVIWTNGIPQNIVQPETNQKVWEVQKLLGSCPYLYAWNGKEYVFVTDLLWAAPIGLQNAAQELVPARSWEYLKISGDLLKPNNGKYKLQLTEELWEVAYFDQLQLIAIDHPADIDIYSNEKVGPPSIAEYQIHQVKNKLIPVSVRNQNGRDLLPEVTNEDQNYAKPFTRRITQGYTDDSYMEIDFGLAEKPNSLKLFMTGWVYPTDTGLNVALAEDQSRPGPSPPSIAVPNEDGEFVEVIPYCGFPGGKTKTIVIDLADKFLTDDYRIRFSTSMELYWDHIFFSTEDATATIVEQPLTCLSADLHHRGVSRIEYSSQNGPEKFLYSESIATPIWPTIDGNFTRFGDVKELLQETDDRLLVIGTGDEVTLEFDLPEKSLPDGWKRDFILHCVGWDKDANLHTVIGQTVEPLPFVKMKSYPFVEDEPHPQDYLKTYQTRQLDDQKFRAALRESLLEELQKTEPRRPE